MLYSVLLSSIPKSLAYIFNYNDLCECVCMHTHTHTFIPTIFIIHLPWTWKVTSNLYSSFKKLSNNST